MTEQFLVKTESRTELGRRARRVRASGFIPAVIYGHGAETRSIKVPAIPFIKVYRAAGSSTLIDLEIDGGDPVKALIQDIAHDPLRGDITHVDFRQVRMDEKLETEIALKFIGEAPAVKDQGGNLVRNLDSLKVRCLPGALVHEIEVDISGLASFDDKIHVGELKIPEGIEILNEPKTTVVFVEAPRSEEELAALEGAPEEDVSAVKAAVEEKKEKEEAEADGSEAEEPAKK